MLLSVCKLVLSKALVTADFCNLKQHIAHSFTFKLLLRGVGIALLVGELSANTCLHVSNHFKAPVLDKVEKLTRLALFDQYGICHYALVEGKSSDWKQLLALDP